MEMTTAQEKAAVQEIRQKRARGEKLTQREWNILAYSPYGTAGGCACGHGSIPIHATQN
jgi:hypothetical protein